MTTQNATEQLQSHTRMLNHWSRLQNAKLFLRTIASRHPEWVIQRKTPLAPVIIVRDV